MKRIIILSVLAILFVFIGCKKEFTINVESNDTFMGKVSGGGIYSKGEKIEIEAIPLSSYQFEKWDDGNTDNPRSIIVTKNVTYTATFAKREQFTISVQSNNEEWGAVSGGGTFYVNTEITIKATPKVGHKFIKWNDNDTNSTRTIIVTKNATYTATLEKEPTSFSVSKNKKVLFSPGNLQWKSGGTHTVAGGGNSAGTWRFAPNQWDTIGANNTNMSSTYSGWIDLFGWGTSGYNNKYPYLISDTKTDYGDGEKDIAGTNYDWGVYNAIYNSKTNTTDAPGTWRTLTKNEWEYLLFTRSTATGNRYAKAKVNGINGLIILPDNWSTSIYNLNQTNQSSAAYSANIITSANWTKLENAGAIFLPAAGYRDSYTRVFNVDVLGEYWSAMHKSSTDAYTLYFTSSVLNSSTESYRYYGRPVRLVKDIE